MSEEKKYKELYCAEYFLCKSRVPADVEIHVGDFLITNVGLQKVISVTDGNIVTEDSDIDFKTARIIDVRADAEYVHPRNPYDVESEDFCDPVEKYDGETVSKRNLDFDKLNH